VLFFRNWEWNDNFIWKADTLLYSSFTSWCFLCSLLFIHLWAPKCLVKKARSHT
jgi:hypothetical protein